MIDRRAFVVAVAGGLIAAPLAVEARPVGKAWRIGFLSGGFGANPPTLVGLRAGLATEGLEEGRHVVFEQRFTEGTSGLLSRAAHEVVAARVDVIVVVGEHAAIAARDATQKLPIVFTNVGDPVAAGLVASLAHPSMNLTGIAGLSTELAPKRIEILRELAPALRRIWAIYARGDTAGASAARAAQRAAGPLGIEVPERPVETPKELAAVLKALGAGDGLLAPVDVTLDIPGQMLIASLWARLPVIFPVEFWTHVGELNGLVSYGSDYEREGRQAARLVAKLLRGARPGELPVEGIKDIRLVINLKTAKALGLTVPPSLLQRADQVIE
jgi:putative ABC transport system substrate-binding protein